MFNFLTKQGIQFLTTAKINSQLEILLENAKEKIILVSPYVKLQKRIQKILAEKKAEGINIFFVCKSEDKENELSKFITQFFVCPDLHAKCYMNENEAIVTSLNLHEYSQQNNIEMGFHIINYGTGKQAYSEILKEVNRLLKPNSTKPVVIKPKPAEPYTNLQLVEKRKYSADELKKIFNFKENNVNAGIKEALNGDVVLFSNKSSPYPIRVIDDIIFYYGQNTGSGPQKLIYGNKLLYNCYGNQSAIIHFFRNSIYKGRFHIKTEPYLEEETGMWIFPLSRKVS